MQGRYDHYERVSCVTEIADEKDGWYRFADTVFYGEKAGCLMIVERSMALTWMDFTGRERSSGIM